MFTIAQGTEKFRPRPREFCENATFVGTVDTISAAIA
jgi:hypothetical protein